MSRNIKQLHPVLQLLIIKLMKECKKQGIQIKIGECYRSVKEQDALYAKGRTVAGIVVTNAKGSTYSSMHQWGIAFDFYLTMDIDKDGMISDDTYNNSTKLFNRVGQIGKSIGLEWGGDWKNFHDLSHFQLGNWGSTPMKLKKKYKTPKKFMETWRSEQIKVRPLSKRQHLVQKGDNLTTIAKKYHTTVNKLIKINRIKNPEKIHIGQILTIQK